MTSLEHIAYGILNYIQLDDTNAYTLVGCAYEILKNTHACSIPDIYSIVFSDILSTQSNEEDPNVETYNSLVMYRIKSYSNEFVKIINHKESHNGNYTLGDIKELNTLICIILKERYKLINQKSNRKFVNTLLDFICSSNADLRSILFKCIQDDYVEI